VTAAAAAHHAATAEAAGVRMEGETMPHMQGRVSPKILAGSSLGAALADEDVIQESPSNVRRGFVAGILQKFKDAKPPISVCVAGGGAIETTGEFVFAVRGANEEEEERELDRALSLLKNYKTSKNTVYHSDIPDEAGELLKFLDSIPHGEFIDEIFVGTPDPNTNLVLVQVTTLRVDDPTPQAS
jgi:hypothetical protein